MIELLQYISSGLIIVSFLIYFIMIFCYRKNKITDSDGFNVSKDIISEYNSINIIESKSYFTFYNIKRKIIKLSSICYYGTNLASISLSLIEAGISIIDSYKNKYIDLFRNLFSNLKILYIFPILGILINNVSYNISDVKVSMIFVLIFIVISYMLIDIKSHVLLWINDNLNKVKVITKDNKEKITKYINNILWLDKIIFIGELVMIVRFVAILLELN